MGHQPGYRPTPFARGLRDAGVTLLFALSVVSFCVTTSSHGAEPEPGYAGSKNCAVCHRSVYEAWRQTRHSYSVLTGAEAEAAGYPLPKPRLRGRRTLPERWADIAYTIGGRQRIAYVDKQGDILDTSFHHRIGRWDTFPTMTLAKCGSCHYTGFGIGRSHPTNRALPGRWVERNIGCESCHGPGAAHAESLDADDIVLNPSSDVCGACHTTVGKVLPKGELHATHDLVQHWNQDPHVTGVRSHSHNTFCAKCHAPYQGHARANGREAGQLVFSEDKRNITCIGCHNPHNVSGVDFRRDAVSLSPPKPVRAHTYEGNDYDITTADYADYEAADDSCLRCHRGADRIDLDHANASCSDCHNTYLRNHGRESRQLHDSNHPRLSCKSCHADADRLMSLVYGDPDFLAPSNIHNLRTLPEPVIARYGFIYSRLRPSSILEVQASGPKDDSQNGQSPTNMPERAIAPNALLSARALFDSATHRAATSPKIARLRARVLAAPQRIPRYFALARSHTEPTLRANVLRLALRATSSYAILLPAPGGTDASRDLPDAPLLQVGFPGLAAWSVGYTQLMGGELMAAKNSFLKALQQSPEDANLALYVALAEHASGDSSAALKRLATNTHDGQMHLPSAVATGMIELSVRRAADAVQSLESAAKHSPSDAVVRYLLGRAYARTRAWEDAGDALRRAVALDPELLEARFALTQLYLNTGRAQAAITAYRAIIEREPDLLRAHLELANVLKTLSDQLAFQLLSMSETRASDGLSVLAWEARQATLRERISRLRGLALTEYAISLTIDPNAGGPIRQIAEIYRRNRRFDEARRIYQWLAERDPSNGQHKYRLGTIAIAQRDYTAAISQLQRALARDPTDGDAYLALGLAYLGAGNADAALQTFLQGEIHEPFNPALYTNLGVVHARLGNRRAARVAFERSLELATFPLPRVHLTHTNLALIAIAEERRDDAQKALKAALHVFPGYTYATQLLDQLDAGSVPVEPAAYVANELLERFGEVTTVTLASE